MKTLSRLTLCAVLTLTSCSVAFSAGMSDVSGKALYQTGKKADYLAGYHGKALGADCAVCHPSQSVSDSEREIDANCQKCHGTYQQLGQKDKSNGKPISAHQGHLSISSCTTCHKGHEESFAYCNNCHIFNMPMKFGRAKVPYAPEDLSFYRNAIPNREETADIVIVGGGGAGMVAAIELQKAGKKVVLLEKMPILGGSSLLATGGMNVVGSKPQKDSGVKDDVDTFVKDSLHLGKGKNDQDLIRILGTNSNDAYEWFESLGGQLELQKGKTGGTTNPRQLYTKSGGIGRYMVEMIEPALVKSGADVRVNSKVVRLVHDKAGQVTGVIVKGKNSGLYQINAKAVILATGSYANNGALVAKYNPQFEGIITTAQPGSHGDGIALASEVGAQVNHLERVQIHPNAAAGTTIMITQAIRNNGGILVNRSGKRFVDDQAARNKLGPEILKQQGGSAFLIYNDEVVEKRKKVHEGYVKLGFVKTADTPEELAKILGLPEQEFAQTIKNYSSYHDRKSDPDFNRKELMSSMRGRLYAIEVIPGIGGTLGGIKANTSMQVLNNDGKVIPGLLACGEVVGEWHGMDRYGGNAVTGNIVFGKIAAKTALEQLNNETN
ncbi:flavocytochrome c [uncultured Parasutterella sp.]|uniref:flavocytochrome c n=1 Tax=uncultured Parasutterella sp. TaxID=1263098 RepID=UPI002595B858|nr:flavocytochrome c [uncultured Parasutterella sp.]